ncbi:hypothetical protein THMIRHAS_16720 [Thiosulfatimonas sediminis]|uniref:Uncharacterized protein n=1 Tax=Thiosulfatimonas sediminis TaxID=2675054 RepID=A0A6F8PW07_9GAMM|nr:hypothetical protein [Thiosulfatimonas sediminis]BBP46299.1 hypothetical protein THMIRHAS_16720 [Thiosulfatimonas sediminis]
MIRNIIVSAVIGFIAGSPLVFLASVLIYAFVSGLIEGYKGLVPAVVKELKQAFLAPALPSPSLNKDSAKTDKPPLFELHDQPSEGQLKFLFYVGLRPLNEKHLSWNLGRKMKDSIKIFPSTAELEFKTHVLQKAGYIKTDQVTWSLS